MTISSKARNGMMLATSAAALVLSGCATHSSNGDKEAMAKDSMAKTAGGNVQCAGINSCKGTSECKTATSSCKGLNECAGHGYITTSAAECAAKNGKVI